MNEQLAEVYIHEPDILQIKPHAKILDVTAGNRHIWGKEKFRDDVVFFDKEPNLKIPADVLGTWDKLPWPDDYFHCIVFDPPQYFGNACPYFQDPKETPLIRHYKPSGLTRMGNLTFYGYPFKNKTEMIRKIYDAQKEFARVSPRLCFKWCELRVNLFNILSIFDKWNIQFIQPYHKQKWKKGSTFWVKMVRKEKQ